MAATTIAASSRRAARASNPNEQVGLGVVGCGIRGMEHLRAFGEIPDVRLLGVCDPDGARVGAAAETIHGAKQWTDLRAMFDSPEIDAVVIATCNHWHALAAIWALEAGKHVYIEKPLSLTHWEGRQLVKASRQVDRIVQVGMQQRSDPMQDELKTFLHHDRTLGAIGWVLVNRFGQRGPIGLRKSPLEPPKSVDYDLWLGPAAELPIYRNSLHYDWHWVWNTGSGEMGNWGVHVLDDVRNVVFRDRVALPSKLVAAGNRFAWHDAGDTPNLQFVVMEASKTPVVISLSNLSQQTASNADGLSPGPSTGYVVFCENGRLEGQRGQAVAFDRKGKEIRRFTGNSGERLHRHNFIDAVRRDDPALLKAPVEVGHYSTAWCNFSNIVTKISHGADTTALSALADEFQLPAAAEVYRQLSGVVARFGGDPASFQLSPVLTCDVESERFAGAHATQANEELRRVARCKFAMPEYTADS